MDDNHAFRVLMRRNFLFGHWVARHLGHEGDAATSYAYRYVNHGMEADDSELVELAFAAVSACRGDLCRGDLSVSLRDFGARAACEIVGAPSDL